jgi:hypothetical protein
MATGRFLIDVDEFGKQLEIINEKSQKLINEDLNSADSRKLRKTCYTYKTKSHTTVSQKTPSS